MSVERERDATWAGHPVYRCKVCGDRFECVDDLAAVLQHETVAHTAARVSPLVGPDGQPIVVVGR